MVIIIPSEGDYGIESTIIPAYLSAPTNTEVLDRIQAAFKVGTLEFGAMYELSIRDLPSYYNRSPEEIRLSLNSTGFEQSFVLIDAQTPHDGAVLYVEQFATQYDVEEGLAARTDVLWKIRVVPEDINGMACNYNLGNLWIHDELEFCGAKWPYDPDARPQVKLSSIGRDSYLRPARSQAVRIVALPGEWEEETTTGQEEFCSSLSRVRLASDAECNADGTLLLNGPPRKSLARLTSEAAKRAGLKPSWTAFSKEEKIFEDVGAPKEGSACFSQFYDVDGPLWTSLIRDHR